MEQIKPAEVYDPVCRTCGIFRVWKEKCPEETEPIRRDNQLIGQEGDCGYICGAQEYLREQHINNIDGRDCICKEILEMNAV